MMPIRPEMRALYPPDWAAISDWVRFDRAMGRCECHGMCGGKWHMLWFRKMPLTTGRCPNYHLERSRFTGTRVILTTAHLDHTPANVDPANLRAMCQACHLAYDAGHHAETRAGRG